MKRFVLKSLLLVLLSQMLFQFSAESVSRLELRCAAFLPSTNLFRSIYGDVGASYQFEASTSIYGRVEVWGNLDWFTKHGHSVGLDKSTKIQMLNSSFGLKVPFHLTEQISPYLGLGIVFSEIWLKDNACCSGSRNSKFEVGGILKTGINYYFYKNFFVDVFADYSYQPVKYQSNVDVGGLRTGLGLGVAF